MTVSVAFRMTALNSHNRGQVVTLRESMLVTLWYMRDNEAVREHNLEVTVP